MEPVSVTTFDAWCAEIQEQDNWLHKEKERIQSMINANNITRAFHHNDKKATLLSRISDSLKTPQYATTTTSNKPTDHKYLPKLTNQDKQLLNEHEGCTCCCTFYAGHCSDTCPMKASRTFPNATNYCTLTASMVEAARPRVTAAFVEAAPCNDDTDSYVSSSTPTPFTIPHLYVVLDLTGPTVREFPLLICALLDIGCPTVIISSSLVDQLGLHHYDLPIEEDNLSSLLDTLLRYQEYVRLQVRSGNGVWKLGVVRAKVNIRLPIPLILGLSFLAMEHIVIDVNLHTTIDKKNWRVKPPKPITLENALELALAGYLLPEPIITLVWECIEVLTDLKFMNKKDLEFKEKHQDRFPIQLPGTLKGVPNHIYHHC
ncbi:hypothetical protein M422DRAFT_267006 [Sphaerobolus stellatus SS14]|uniref:Unplaced genomic scaffold SPHSTscaffold_169, whole genome shotgun sequence n=1 Tax=Sphaerobolus stellatus (strain SS14) TaxID=990650 RepID=A0A0C9V1J2_SPHS4|nr:hypothetical protein M422DRAFT_267006 [Sphaerobolus stellatus SS14]